MSANRNWKEIVTLAMPVVISKLSFTFMGLVDTAMVGRIGVAEQAAVGIATTFMFTVYVFGLGVIGAVNTLVSQLDGAARPERCGQVLSEGLRAATVIGAATWLVLFFSEPFFVVAGLSEEVAGYGYTYLLFRITGLFPVFWYWTFNAYLEGLGDTATPMWITLAGNLVNLVLDYAFIFGAGPIPAMGVAGAGLATALGNIFMFACFAWAVFRKRGIYRSRFGARLIDTGSTFGLLRQLLVLGVPMGIQFFLEVGAYLVFSIFVGWVSDTALAAHQVAIRVMSISFMTAFGIGTAATTLVGRYQGKRRSDLAEQAGMGAVGLMAVYTIFCGVAFAAFPHLIGRIFTSSTAVVEAVIPLLYAAAVFQFFDGVNMVGYSALKGAGDTGKPLMISVVAHWAVGVPLVYWLTIHSNFGALGAWVGMCVMIAVQAVLIFLRFRRGAWKGLTVATIETGAAE